MAQWQDQQQQLGQHMLSFFKLNKGTNKADEGSPTHAGEVNKMRLDNDPETLLITFEQGAQGAY